MSERRAADAAGLRRSIIVTAVALLIVLALVLWQPDAFAGWLVAFLFWSSLPIGGLCFLMMMRLIPGAWREEFAAPGHTVVLLVPAAALAMLPILALLPMLYDWAGGFDPSGFRSVYLTPPFFILRTVLFFAVLMTLVVLLITRPLWSTPVAAVGLIVFVLLDTMMAVDWLMSLDNGFHSSGFGLYILTIQMTVALAMMSIVRLWSPPGRVRTGLHGSLLLSALLLWAYMAYMQYVIIWSTDLPPGVAWYERRAVGFWSAIEYVVGGLGLLPLLLLLFPPVRNSRPWMLGLAVAVLIGKAFEFAWLVLPAGFTGPAAIASTIVALIGLGLLFWIALPIMRRATDRLRPNGAYGREFST